MVNKSLSKLLAVIVCLLVISVSTYAQKREFSLAIGGGWQGPRFSMKNGDQSLKPGFGVELGYMHSLHQRWGVITGVGIGYYRSKATLNPDAAFTSYEIDSENSAFEYRVRANGYREEQKIWAINIPVMLQFHPRGNQNGVYAQLGIRMGLPISNKYSTNADQITATGFYPNYNLEITDLPVHGFGTQSDWKGTGEYEFKPSWSAAAELGWRFRLTAKKNLYTGFYLDYGLNNIKERAGEGTLLQYQPDGLSQSKAAGVFSLKDETGDVRLMAYGIKLRIGFGSAKTKKKVAPVPLPVAEVAPVPQLVTVTDTAVAAVDPVIIDSVVVTVSHEDTLSSEEKHLLETPFLFGKVGDTSLSETAKQQASAIAALMKKHEGLQLAIEGHTCNIGSGAVNRRIGLARAYAVAAALQAEGVEAGRLQVLSRGHLEPFAPNNNETNRKKNRRVLLKVL